MECKLDDQLGYEKSERVSNSAAESSEKNYRNGYSPKTVKPQLGEVELKIPQDRNGEFEPQIISKYSRSVDGIEEKIIGLYACGMSQRDIAEQIKALYDVKISPDLVSKISEKLMPEVTAWQNRPLEAVYLFSVDGLELEGSQGRHGGFEAGLPGCHGRGGLRESHSLQGNLGGNSTHPA